MMNKQENPITLEDLKEIEVILLGSKIIYTDNDREQTHAGLEEIAEENLTPACYSHYHYIQAMYWCSLWYDSNDTEHLVKAAFHLVLADSTFGDASWHTSPEYFYSKALIKYEFRNTTEDYHLERLFFHEAFFLLEKGIKLYPKNIRLKGLKNFICQF